VQDVSLACNRPTGAAARLDAEPLRIESRNHVLKFRRAGGRSATRAYADLASLLVPERLERVVALVPG